jgi:hypothetical protein
VYDLLALAANPNHPALQHTDTEVNLHVKLNEFGQGTQIVSLPEVRARTVPDAVSDVGTMSPLMFCAAISSANLVRIAYRIQYTHLVLFNRDPLQKNNLSSFIICSCKSIFVY